MEIAVFGSTGSVGCHIVSQALEAGHVVRAFARNPSALELDHPNLKPAQGDVYDMDAVMRAVTGVDAVLVTLGNKKLTGRLRSEGTANIIKAMEASGVRRLICQSTLGVGDSRANLNFYWKRIMFGMILRVVFQDHVIQERFVETSSLDWTIVRPAAFTDGPMTDNYKHGFSAKERKLTLKISRADVAQFMLQQLSSDRYYKTHPGLSY